MRSAQIIVDGVPIRWEEAGEGVPAPDLVRIRGGKHFVPEDHPDDIAAAITEVAKEADFGGAR